MGEVLVDERGVPGPKSQGVMTRESEIIWRRIVSINSKLVKHDNLTFYQVLTPPTFLAKSQSSKQGRASFPLAKCDKVQYANYVTYSALYAHSCRILEHIVRGIESSRISGWTTHCYCSIV